MWIITHIPTGNNILGWEETSKGFYSYKEAHKMLLTIFKYINRGAYLYGPDFCYFTTKQYMAVIKPLSFRSLSGIYWNYLRIYRMGRIYKLAGAFEHFNSSESKDNLIGNKIVNILCERAFVRHEYEPLCKINKSEFLIHYVN